MTDRQLRLALGLAGGLAAVGLVYASIVPLTPRSLAWADAVVRFRQTPWLDLGVYRRADWVANGLVALPFGFLLAGAVDRQPRRWLRYAGWLVAIMLGGNALIVGIEFLQVWFPPRTVSINDIVAGCLGATLGPLLWPLVGRPAVHHWQRWRERSQAGPLAVSGARGLLVAFLVVVLLYSVMPLDLVLTRAELRMKWEAGRLAWGPGLPSSSGGLGAWAAIGLTLLLSTARMVPVGFLVVLARLRQAILLRLLIGFPIVLEAAQAIVFTRYATLADVVCGWAGGLVGMVLATQRHVWRSWNERSAVRILLAAGLVVLAAVAFLGRYQRWATAEEVRSAWEAFWMPPFVKYYYTSEFSAGSNIAGKMIVFAAVGAGLANLLGGKLRVASCELRGARGRLRLGFALAAAVVVGLGVLIEVAQVYLVPFQADASDVLIYTAGAGFGWAGYRIVIGWRVE